MSEAPETTRPSGTAMPIAVIAVLFALFHIWTSGAGSFPALRQNYIHLGFALVLVFLARPVFGEARAHSPWRWVIDGGLVLAAIAVAGYVVVNFLDIAWRGAGDPRPMGVWLGIVAVVLVLEATRRTVGLAMPLLAGIFLVYAFVGPHLPGAISHRGYSIERLAAVLYLTPEGIAGVPLSVSATYVAIFVIFASFLDVSGAGRFFIDWSYALFGRVRGGPAKVAVVASACMGTISGSAVANVASTGPFTIPLMKHVGLRPKFAGAVEAASSSGGQIMPPIMGAAAFLMVEILGIPYTEVISAAILPALLYFLGVFVMVDFEVAKGGIRGQSADELPDGWQVFRSRGILILPLLVLLYFLFVVEYTAVTSAFYALVTLFAVSMLRPETRLTPIRFYEGLRRGGMAILEVASVCACAGIIIGIMMLTGLGIRLSELIIALAGGHLFSLLLLTMAASLVLGMGLPSAAVYIVLATLISPALVRMGVEPLAAHLFVFYFGILGNVTPPVAISAYAAAAIAGANAMATGVMAFRLALAGFLLPFIWVYNPALLMMGDALTIMRAVATAAIGVFALAAAVQGYLFGRLAMLHERFLLGGAAFALLFAGLTTDLVGAGLLVAALASRLRLKGNAVVTRT